MAKVIGTLIALLIIGVLVGWWTRSDVEDAATGTFESSRDIVGSVIGDETVHVIGTPEDEQALYEECNTPTETALWHANRADQNDPAIAEMRKHLIYVVAILNHPIGPEPSQQIENMDTPERATAVRLHVSKAQALADDITEPTAKAEIRDALTDAWPACDRYAEYHIANS